MRARAPPYPHLSGEGDALTPTREPNYSCLYSLHNTQIQKGVSEHLLRPRSIQDNYDDLAILTLNFMTDPSPRPLPTTFLYLHPHFSIIHFQPKLQPMTCMVAVPPRCPATLGSTPHANAASRCLFTPSTFAEWPRSN